MRCTQQPRTFSSIVEPDRNGFSTPSRSDLAGNRALPVVFFHGGGLIAGASSEIELYEEVGFAKTQGRVFVSINTRLNILSFLDVSECGEKYTNSGLAGILDGVVALEWNRDNISRFGGDPVNVTIVGQSDSRTKIMTLACMEHTGTLLQRGHPERLYLRHDAAAIATGDPPDR